MHNVLINGQWRDAISSGSFRAENPAASKPLDDEYPISTWADCDVALTAAAEAAATLRQVPPEKIAQFLNLYAQRIEARAEEIIAAANLETALPVTPRLKDIELPRTTTQLRQAAAAALEGSWALATIDTKNKIRSCYQPLGPVAVFGPNNFPFAFNGVSGGDFAAAIAAGNPVIAKGHPSHPTTTRLLAQEALAAIQEAGLPPATLQLIYHMEREAGLKLVADPRIGATAFTGSRAGGLALKAAADAAGKPIYLEMSSVNPVVILPGALAERSAKIADEYADSALAAAGQFCTNPGLVILIAGSTADAFIAAIKERFTSRAAGTLLSQGVCRGLGSSVQKLMDAGAKLLLGGLHVRGESARFANTLLTVDGETFLANSHALQTEAFGNASLMVVAQDFAQACQILSALEGNLTGCIYSDTAGADDKSYDAAAQILRPRVGRLLNDKMPTGVALSPAMNHGGPYPATGHPGFSAVGIPGSLRRFAMLASYDNVRLGRLPAALQDKSPNGSMQRLIDGKWTTADVSG